MALSKSGGSANWYSEQTLGVRVLVVIAGLVVALAIPFAAEHLVSPGDPHVQTIKSTHAQ